MFQFGEGCPCAQLFNPLKTVKGKVNVKVKLRQKVSRPVSELSVAGLLIWGILSDERPQLSFTIAAGPRHCGHSRVRVPWDSSYFTVSDLRLPQPVEPGLRIYIPQ
jgi:hypothetical protein